MNKWLKHGLIALSLVLTASTAAAAVAPSLSVAAVKKPAARKMDQGVYKKKLAELAKTSAAVKKQQNALYDTLYQHIDVLTGQIGEIFGDPTAAGSTEDEMFTFFMDTLTKLSEQDESVQEYFLQDELDQLSASADSWLAKSAQMDKLTASYDKLTASFKDYEKQKKYQEALNVRQQQINLDKKINEVLTSFQYIDNELYGVFYDILDAQSEAESSGDSYDSYNDDSYSNDDSVYGEVYR